jgi:hypothetical protein
LFRVFCVGFRDDITAYALKHLYTIRYYTAFYGGKSMGIAPLRRPPTGSTFLERRRREADAASLMKKHASFASEPVRKPSHVASGRGRGGRAPKPRKSAPENVRPLSKYHRLPPPAQREPETSPVKLLLSRHDEDGAPRGQSPKEPQRRVGESDETPQRRQQAIPRTAAVAASQKTLEAVDDGSVAFKLNAIRQRIAPIASAPFVLMTRQWQLVEESSAVRLAFAL